MDKILEKTAGLMLAGIFIILIACLLAWPVQGIWNDLAPSIFKLRKITFAESIELLLFFQIITDSFASLKDE